jgi:hypothetical protein
VEAMWTIALGANANRERAKEALRAKEAGLK